MFDVVCPDIHTDTTFMEVVYGLSLSYLHASDRQTHDIFKKGLHYEIIEIL